MTCTFVSASSLQAKLGLPLASQVTGWATLCTSHLNMTSIYVDDDLAIAILPPFLVPRTISANNRMLVYFLTFCPCFIVLSIRAEGLFYASYCATLWLWIEAESAVRSASTRQEQGEGTAQSQDENNTSTWNPGMLRLDDVRIGLFFLFFVQVGFFGTGKCVAVPSTATVYVADRQAVLHRYRPSIWSLCTGWYQFSIRSSWPLYWRVPTCV